MPWILVASYIIVHFLLYACILRHRPFFWRERGILLFYLVPAAILVTLVFGAFLWQPSFDRFATSVGAFAVCGIYTLSFMEFWLLSDGGYSLRILCELARMSTATPKELELHFIDLSARKKLGRLESLIGLGLAERDDDRYQLSRKGSALASVMALIAVTAGFRAPD